MIQFQQKLSYQVILYLLSQNSMLFTPHPHHHLTSTKKRETSLFEKKTRKKISHDTQRTLFSFYFCSYVRLSAFILLLIERYCRKLFIFCWIGKSSMFTLKRFPNYALSVRVRFSIFVSVIGQCINRLF